MMKTGCLVAKANCQFFYIFPIGYFGFKAHYFSLSFPSLKLVDHLWLFILCGLFYSTYLCWSSNGLWVIQ